MIEKDLLVTWPSELFNLIMHHHEKSYDYRLPNLKPVDSSINVDGVHTEY